MRKQVNVISVSYKKDFMLISHPGENLEFLVPEKY
jgi:hypothetical protein